MNQLSGRMPMRLLTVLAAASALAACAAQPTPYQPKVDGMGYSQRQIDGRTWRVEFAGTADTARETVETYLLYRCAEIMRFGGFEKFVILEKDVERDTDYHGTGFGTGFGFGGPHAFSSIWYGGPADYYSVVRYRAVATIRVYTGGAPPANAPVYDTDEMIRQLGPKIVLPERAKPS
jgi:hypothetical protein